MWFKEQHLYIILFVVSRAYSHCNVPSIQADKQNVNGLSTTYNRETIFLSWCNYLKLQSQHRRLNIGISSLLLVFLAWKTKLPATNDYVGTCSVLIIRANSYGKTLKINYVAVGIGGGKVSLHSEYKFSVMICEKKANMETIQQF